MRGAVTEAWPLLSLIRLLGWFPFSRNSRDRLQVRLFSLPALYSACVLSVFMARGAFIVYRGFQTFPLLDPQVRFMRSGQLVLGVAIPQLFGIFAALQAPQQARFFNRLVSMQEELAALSEPPDVQVTTLGLGWLARGGVAAGVTVLLVLWLLQPLLLGGPLPSVGVGLYMPLCFAYLPLMLAWWMLAMRAIVRCSGNLTTIYNNARKIHSFKQRTSLVLRSRDYWLRVTDLVKRGGEAIALAHMTFVLLGLAAASYASFELLQTQNTGFVFLVSVLVAALGIFYTVCSAAQVAADTVHNDILAALTITPELNLPPNITCEVCRYLYHLSCRPVHVSYAGYVVVNRSLISTFVSSLLSNLVVLKQLPIPQRQFDFRDFFTDHGEI